EKARSGLGAAARVAAGAEGRCWAHGPILGRHAFAGVGAKRGIPESAEGARDRSSFRPGGSRVFATVERRRPDGVVRLQGEVGRRARLLLLRLGLHLNARAWRPGPGRG